MRAISLIVTLLAVLALAAAFTTASPSLESAVMESELDASVEWVEPMFLEADADAETEVDADADADAEAEVDADADMEVDMEAEQGPKVSPAQVCEICSLAITAKVTKQADCDAHKTIASGAEYKAVCHELVNGKGAAAALGNFYTQGCLVGTAKAVPCPAANACASIKRADGSAFCPPANAAAVSAAAAPSSAAPPAAPRK